MHGIRLYRDSHSLCDRFIGFLYAVNNFPYLEIHNTPPAHLVRLEKALNTQLLDFADSLLAEDCPLSPTQSQIADIFNKKSSTLFERVFQKNASFLLTAGLQFDAVFVSMHVLARYVDLLTPSEWNTALTLASLKLDFAIWRNPHDEDAQPFAAEIDEKFFPKTNIQSLFTSVLKMRCRETPGQLAAVEVPVEGGSKAAKEHKVCEVVKAQMTGLSDTQSVETISEILGSAIRSLANQPEDF